MKELDLANRIRRIHQRGFTFYISEASRSSGLIPPNNKSIILRTWMTAEEVDELLCSIEKSLVESEMSPCMNALKKELGVMLKPCQ
jgi:hypothetical protein